ncbi:hypothetical protein FRC10_012222 [Ceratobasidium sp. 414]|nr:hypothetical protein FRC10_012222 [Ceratobasidium sp. 414]
MKPVWKRDEGAMGSYYQFKRDEPTCLGSAPPPDRTSETVEIHEYASDAESDAEDKFDDDMEVDEDEGVDGGFQ